MMRGPKKSAMAVRNPEGEIVLEKWDTESGALPKVAKLPIIRGVINFVRSMMAGYKCLMRSAEIAGLEDAVNEVKVEKELADKKSGKTAKKEKKQKETGKEKNRDKEKAGDSSALMAVIMIVATVLGVVMAVGLFIMLPTFLYDWFSRLMPFLRPEDQALRSLSKSVFEGLFKIVILVAYMALVSLMKDIRRTFQYHGAEHKTIFCYEHNKELTVENVRGERRFHPRCGTSFLMLMVLVGIFVSFFIDPLFIWITGNAPATWLRAVLRLLLFPITMGLGYELLKLAGKHDNWLIRVISAPGLWLQRVTVLEPTDDMIECAILAFSEVIPEEEKTGLETDGE
ncbi:MAG: DUF1385 domain-containing protein [Clostridia bacterium]|nr:DUF1385 domain-containing protein [Clostridia bacterium]